MDASPVSKKPQITTKHTSSRLPPPSLFQGPPSHNASNISLVPPGAGPGSSARTPGLLGPSVNPLGRPAAAPGPINRSISARARDTQAQNDSDRADALWAEMQNTLAEVELSAEGGSHIFGGEHAKALEELRAAQLGLAQAWARSEADDGNEATAPGEEGKVGKASDLLKSTSGDTQGAKGENFGESKGKKLEEETEHDILLARKRREANDRYFQRVNAGVLDVVAKLEDVALAMKAVEKESRDIWSEGDSLDTASTEAG